jgi:hypothetical protein
LIHQTFMNRYLLIFSKSLTMQKIVLNIEESHYGLFLQFLKTLDYVNVVQVPQNSDDQKDNIVTSPFHWLELLALEGGVQSIENASDWQRMVRADRELHR